MNERKKLRYTIASLLDAIRDGMRRQRAAAVRPTVRFRFTTEGRPWNVTANLARLCTSMPRKPRPPPAPKQPDPPPNKPAAGLQEQPDIFDLLMTVWSDQTDPAPLPAPSKVRRPKPR